MPNGNDLPVYQEWDHILIRTSYNPEFYYRVFFGGVDWERDGDIRPAYTVFYQRGSTDAWQAAGLGGDMGIRLREPAHIMEEDLDQVIEALQTLRQHRRDQQGQA